MQLLIKKAVHFLISKEAHGFLLLNTLSITF